VLNQLTEQKKKENDINVVKMNEQRVLPTSKNFIIIIYLLGDALEAHNL